MPIKPQNKVGPGKTWVIPTVCMSCDAHQSCYELQNTMAFYDARKAVSVAQWATHPPALTFFPPPTPLQGCFLLRVVTDILFLAERLAVTNSQQFLPVITLCVYCCALQKEASLTSADSITNYGEKYN